MNENIKTLLTQIAESEELQAKFAGLDTPEKAYELAKTLQDGFTKEEFLEAAKEIAEAQIDDVSDEELAAAAGGTDAEMDCRPVTDDRLSKLSKLTPGRTNKTATTQPPTTIRETIIKTTKKMSNI